MAILLTLDNAPIHTAKKLKIPDNVILLFQPPYCPRKAWRGKRDSALGHTPCVNPIERVWEYIKYYLRSLWFIDLNNVKEKVASILNSLDEKIVTSLANWEFFSKALCL